MRMRPLVGASLLAATLLLVVCKKDKSTVGLDEAPAPTPPPPESAVQSSGIEWIEDDYPAALARAEAENKPLVIDMWAAWCHTCIAMQSGTLRSPGLAEQAESHVWLAVDTEAPSNAAVMAKYPPKVWPTFLVVSPVDGSVQATQLGSCSVTEFRDFLVRGQHGHLAQLGETLAPESALFLLREGDRHWTKDAYADAAVAYGRALLAGGTGWPFAASTLTAQISALSKASDKAECAALGQRELERMSAEHNASGADFLYYAGTCADALPAESKTSLLEGVLLGLETMAADAGASLSADDRSSVLQTARFTAESLGKPEAALAFASRQQALLNQAVASATSPLEEMAYIYHQVELHAFLKQGDAIMPWIDSLAQRLPREYDPPYRKSWLLLQMGRSAEAHQALDVAMPLALGARKGTMIGLRAEIYKAENNTEMERQMRSEALRYYESLAEGQVSARALSSAKAALESLDKAQAPKK